MHMKEEEESQFSEFLQQPQNALLCNPRVTLLAYVSHPHSYFHTNYPINILRNIAIRHTTTSHFLLLDMDMLISVNAYETIMKLPSSYVENEKNAFVLPAFFATSWKLPDLPLELQMKAYF